MRILAGFIAFAVLAAGFIVRADDPTKEELLKLEQRLKAAHENIGPAIACVVVSRNEHYPKPAKPTAHPGQLGGFDPAEFLKAAPGLDATARRLDLANPENIPDHGYAGGVVIDPAGLVLVNYHTIDGATKIYVHLPGMKGSYADIHAADDRSDLAVLKLLTPPEGMKAVRFARLRLPDRPNDQNATLSPGSLGLMLVNAYSTGFKMDRPSGGLFTVSNVRRADPERNAAERNQNIYDYYHYGPLIEFPARSNPGCSGAAMLNLDGELVGLTTTIAAVTGGETGPGYALPLEENNRRIVEVLRRGEEVEYGFLGVSRRQDNGLRPPGIVVESVTPRSPAAAAGIHPHDLITRINDHPVRTFEDLLRYIGSGLAGHQLRLRIERNGMVRDVEVTLAKFKNDMPYIASVRPEPVFGLRVDYGSILAQTIIFGRFGGSPIRDMPAGVVVRELVPDSPAAAKFKTLPENGRWVITQVNGTPTPTPPDFYKAAKGQASVKLTVEDATLTNARRELTLP